ncbi:MAG: Lrp/AsnC family transcriptional regulator [Candidatus Lokiarchaeota archaeon]|nr:Lrp/AsnC family transcriptional regulator [Candidatus Lokiarchaeota archaeon]
MDEIDIKICMLLMANSRTPYKEFAELFRISVNSIHKRIRSLVDLKIIQGFKARLGFSNFLNVSNIVMFGIPIVKNQKELLRVLGENENIYNVTRASGSLFYIYAYIRNTSDLDYLVSHVRKAGKISELTIGIDRNEPSFSLKDTKKLSDMDFLIIDSLKNNSRKKISDISNELDISTKTVSRRLDNLINNFLIQFQIDWYPDNSGQVISNIILKLKSDLIVDDNELIKNLSKQYGSKILFTWSFSNLPNIKIVSVWTRTMKELQNIETSFISDIRYESVEVTVLIEGKMYSTWIDKQLEDKIKDIKQNLN